MFFLFHYLGYASADIVKSFKHLLVIHSARSVLIPQACRDKAHTLVVYTPAVPQNHHELTWFREQGFEIQKRAQVLGTITRSRRGLCVAGTHGKTTVSGMMSTMLELCGMDPTVVIGGILPLIGSNAKPGNGEYLVAEADESDGTFLLLLPEMTNLITFILLQPVR